MKYIVQSTSGPHPRENYLETDDIFEAVAELESWDPEAVAIMLKDEEV